MKVKNFKMILNSLSTWNNQHSHVVSEFKRTCFFKKSTNLRPRCFNQHLSHRIHHSPRPFNLVEMSDIPFPQPHRIATFYLWVWLAPAFTYNFYTKNLFGCLGDVTVEHVAHNLPSFFERANEATHTDNSPPNPSLSFSQRISWRSTTQSHMIYWIYPGDM